MSFACKTATLKLPVSMGHGKGHFNLWGLRAVMLLRLTMTQSGCLKKKKHVNVQMSTEGTPLSVMTIWCMFIPGVWTVAEFWSDIFEFRLPESLNAFLRHCFLIPVECSCWSSRGLELPWPSLLPRRYLKADSQIRPLFFFFVTPMKYVFI